MVKLLLSCDEFVYEHNGAYYAANQEKFELFERYLRIFDRIRLACRCETETKLKESRVPLAQNPGIEFFPVPMFHGIKDYARVYFQVGSSLKNVVKGCDAALLRVPSTLALRVGNLVMRSKIPYACEVVYDAEDGWRGYKGLSRLAWKRIDKQMRVLCSKADGISCVTEHYLQQHYFSLKQDSFTAHYSSLALKKEFYGQPKKYNTKNSILIAHISQNVGEQSGKGHRQTIEAIKLLKDRGFDVRVKFVGNDRKGGIEQYKQYGKELGVGNEVQFTGFLNKSDISNLLSDADIYVMPTKAEGLPRVIIEAMAKGLPCITTPVSGNPELVGEHFLVDYYDTETLANRIEELASDPQLYEKTSKENYDRSLKYEASVLEKRRDSFYTKLRNRI